MTKRKDAGAKLAAEADALAPVAKLIQAQIRVKPGDADDSHELVSVRVFEMDIMQAMRAAVVFQPLRESFVGSTNFLAFAMKEHEAMHEFLGIALGWPPERVASMATGSFFRVAAAVFEANPDFFTLLLGLADTAPKATNLRANGAGETASASSKSAGTTTASATP